MDRIPIYTKDVVIITGRTERQSRYILGKIKVHLNKEPHQPITIDEFCSYMGFPVEKVKPLLR